MECKDQHHSPLFLCKKTTYDHFFAKAVPKSTIYDTIKRFEDNGNIEYKPLSGRPKTVATTQVIRKIKSAFEEKPGTSVRNLANKIKAARSTLSDIKIEQLYIITRTKKVVLRYIQNQEARAKPGARFVCDKVRQKILVIDDQTYVPKYPEDVPKRKFYHCSGSKDNKFHDKVKHKTNF
ncbi:hypothetical protein ILUMI_27199 [Ignelater luminosus]|uniref:DUF4817 domain-containing protein n=1 Tax=Ignelater luminosus TaxID=2038154 RepID=A0A8K0FYE1_IGNLU|nr:hypothetical protein ILUMI_27199 [Ignelater luminosus]